MQDPGLISVRTEVVLDVLVDSMARAVEERMSRALPADAETALARAALLIDTAPPEGAAVRVARRGWHARGVERARFERAREEDLLLTATLSGIAACAELAGREPLDRPEPDDERAITWRIPGPGGHVRHYLAARAVAALAPGERAPGMKRCWVFGFVLACARPEALRPSGCEGP